MVKIAENHATFRRFEKGTGFPLNRAASTQGRKWDFCRGVGYPGPVVSSPVPLGEVFADKYRVDRVLGEGGMGVVVAAHHLELDQPVAIKFLLDDLANNEEGAERFRREARAAAKIQSDHVVRVLDVGVLDSGERYMVMEYMEGRDLSEEIAEKGTLPIGVATGIILEALDAVGHAHAVGIVHRDLKPANLYLAERPDGSQRVKVLDFGISKSIGSATAEEMSLTKTSAWIGSPLYMAPEQMQSARDVDHRADIWSLGAILYELIAGRPPYQAESLPQLCNLLITTDPDPIQSLVPSIPEGLAAAIMKCLARDRDHRTASTSELARVLVNYASSITGSALRKSLLDRTEFNAGSPAQGAFAAMTETADGVSAGRGQVSSSTNAAWAATDAGDEKRSGGKARWILAALVAAGAVGFFMLTGSGKAPGTVEAAAAVGPGSSQEDPMRKPESVPDERPASPSPKEAAAVPEPAEKDADPVLPPEVDAAGPQTNTAPRVARPVAAPRQLAAPRPAPAVAPKPERSDDFSDFGGRR